MTRHDKGSIFYLRYVSEALTPSMSATCLAPAAPPILLDPPKTCVLPLALLLKALRQTRALLPLMPLVLCASAFRAC